MCVCNIWIDVKLLSLFLPLSSPFLILNSMQGAPGAWIGQVPTKTPIQCLWYHGWSPWRTCQFFSEMGRGSTQEPQCHIIYFFTVATICIFAETMSRFLLHQNLYLICMFQDSVPAGSYNDPFLSSVISMVAPTWCHGAIWGNPL